MAYKSYINKAGHFVSEEFQQAVNEYFDIHDTETRKVITSLNEDDQSKTLHTLANKLYDNIVEKSTEINFGDIPKTKGDITKLPDYEKLIDCLDTMKKILIEFHEPTKPVDTINTALDNLRSRKDIFERAFRIDLELPQLLYNTIYLACVSATSFMISCCVEFIKQPTNDTFAMAVDKVGLAKTRDNLLFTNLEKFNDACSKGQVDNSVEYIIKSRTKNFLGPDIIVIAQGVAVVGLLLVIIPLMRELIYFFFYARTRVSDYFGAQAELLQMNAYHVQANQSIDPEKRDTIAKKQMAVANSFNKIANFLAIKMKKADNDATKDIIASTKKFKADEVFDELPDSGAVALF